MEVHGKTGNVKVNASAVVGIKNWTLKYTQALADVTNFSDAGVNRSIPGGSKWSGSFQGMKTAAPLDIVGLGAVSAEFDESAAGTQKWAGTIIITDISVTTDATKEVTYNYSFQGTGALTLPTT